MRPSGPSTVTQPRSLLVQIACLYIWKKTSYHLKKPVYICDFLGYFLKGNTVPPTPWGVWHSESSQPLSLPCPRPLLAAGVCAEDSRSCPRLNCLAVPCYANNLYTVAFVLNTWNSCNVRGRLYSKNNCKSSHVVTLVKCRCFWRLLFFCKCEMSFTID